MNLFITAETTSDVGIDELSPLLELAQLFNSATDNKPSKSIDFIEIVCIIMNPAVAPPFPDGVIYRRKKRDLDIKVGIEFEKWRNESPDCRANLMVNNVLSLLKKHTFPDQIREDIHLLEYILSRILHQYCSGGVLKS